MPYSHAPVFTVVQGTAHGSLAIRFGWTRFQFWCVLIAAIACGTRSTFAEIHPDADELLRKVIAIQASDRSLLSAAGEAVLEYTSSDTDRSATWDVRFLLNEKKLLVEKVLRADSANLPPEQLFETVRVVADGRVMVVGLFSIRIHPDGSQAECRDDNPQGFCESAKGLGFDLRSCLLPPLLRSEKVLEGFLGDEAVVSKESANSLMILYKNESFWRIQTSPEFDHRITKAERGSKRNPEVPQLILNYDWIREDDECHPREITIQQFQLKRYDQNRLTFKNFTRDAESSSIDFSLQALELSPRCILQDRRPTAKVRVRNVRLGELKADDEYSLINAIEALPPRN